jgi:transposase
VILIDNRIDWNSIRAEYIGGGISQRKLAAKYDITYAALRNKAETEGWLELREEAQRKSNAKATQRVASSAAENAVMIIRAAMRSLDFIVFWDYVFRWVG